jgi:fumarate reductase flavoprotein subunit
LVFEKVSLSGAQSVPRNHSIDPVLVLDTLHDAVLTAGVEYRSMAPVRSLVKSQEGNGAVVGVELIDDERVMGRRGVVIETGGFSRSAELVERFVPHLRVARPMGGYGNTGDGLRMAWALGADLVDMGYVKGTFGAPAWYGKPMDVDEEQAPRLLSAMYRGAIVVNQAGKRFCDESISYKEIGELCLQQKHARAFQLFDQQVMNQSSELPTVANFNAAHRAGLFVEAPSIDALARALDIDPPALSETVRNYKDA